MGLLKQNTAYVKMFFLGGTGLGPSALISKNGGTFVTPAGGAGMTEVGSNWYSLALQAGDTDTIGDLAYSFSNGTMSASFVDQVTVNGPDGGGGLDAAGTRTAIGLAAANLDTQLGTIGSLASGIPGIAAKTTNLPASPAAVGSAMTLTSGERDAIGNALLNLANAIETGIDPRGALKLAVAALSGLLSISGNTVSIQNPGGTKTRILATVNAQNERTAITFDVS